MTDQKQVDNPEDVDNDARYMLFVEGSYENSIDPHVLSELLLQDKINVEPLGKSFHINSAAEALSKYHPNYYFLIDRDYHHKNAYVERCWREFPNKDTHNLLVWRRKEIENYFLEPEYLVQSEFCKVNQDALSSEILKRANERKFLDVANHVIVSIREDLKKNWIEIYDDKHLPSFKGKDAALNKLKSMKEFDKHPKNVAKMMLANKIEDRFMECLDTMTGGREKLAFGEGDWLSMVGGKAIFNPIVSSPKHFIVRTNDGSPLQGQDKFKEVTKSLLKGNVSYQPKDFIELKELIRRRVN